MKSIADELLDALVEITKDLWFLLKVFVVFITIPIWVIPYLIIRKRR